MRDFLFFRKLVTPVIVQILFWMGISVWLFKMFGLVNELRLGQSNIMAALTLIVVWPLTLRLYCEIIMLIFKINENLLKLNQKNNS
ncbi:MAG: DUF4282 domain-containing protein [Candidatus Omnitrophica bacterium]|nr:DUF4282 domain-containing protein [Candidatus Omnitrophota bacterium]